MNPSGPSMKKVEVDPEYGVVIIVDEDNGNASGTYIEVEI